MQVISRYRRCMAAAARLNAEACNCAASWNHKAQFTPCAKSRVYIDASYGGAPMAAVTQQAATTECNCHRLMTFETMIGYEYADD